MQEQYVHPHIEIFRTKFYSVNVWQYERRLIYRGGKNHLPSKIKEAQEIIKENNLNLEVSDVSFTLSPIGCFAVDVVE